MPIRFYNLLRLVRSFPKNDKVFFLESHVALLARINHLMPETTFLGALRQQMCFDSSVSFWGAGRMSDGFHTVPLNFKQARHSFEFRGIISVTLSFGKLHFLNANPFLQASIQAYLCNYTRKRVA